MRKYGLETGGNRCYEAVIIILTATNGIIQYSKHLSKQATQYGTTELPNTDFQLTPE
jgi:hypothetical protein